MGSRTSISPSTCLLKALRQTDFVRPFVPIPRPSADIRSSKYAPSRRRDFLRAYATGPNTVQRGSPRVQLGKPALSRDRGPASKEDTQTDFGAMNVLGSTQAPTSSIDACLSDGFHFGNGMKIEGGSGCLILGGEVFMWRPWNVGTNDSAENTGLLNKKGQWHVEPEAWSLLRLLQPKPGNSVSLVVIVVFLSEGADP